MIEHLFVMENSIPDVDLLKGFRKKLKPFAQFVGRTKAHIVKGRNHYRIKNTYSPSFELPFSEGTFPYNEEDRNELEQAYYDFCKKVYSIARSQFGGDIYVKQVIIPDFKFDIVTNQDELPIK